MSSQQYCTPHKHKASYRSKSRGSSTSKHYNAKTTVHTERFSSASSSSHTASTYTRYDSGTTVSSVTSAYTSLSASGLQSSIDPHRSNLGQGGTNRREVDLLFVGAWATSHVLGEKGRCMKQGEAASKKIEDHKKKTYTVGHALERKI